MKPFAALLLGTLLVLGIVYYLLPLLVMQEEGLAWFLLLIVNPVVCILTGIPAGIAGGIKKSAILHPLICGAAFFPSIFLYYNDSALVYLPIYICVAVMGLAVGWIILYRK